MYELKSAKGGGKRREEGGERRVGPSDLWAKKKRENKIMKTTTHLLMRACVCVVCNLCLSLDDRRTCARE